MKNNIRIRPYRSSDLLQISQLFYDTVHAVNRQDYSQEEIEAWAPDPGSEARSTRPFENSYTYVAELNGQIVGFGDLTPEGELDRLYVHKDFQRRGIASTLLETLEAKARDLHLTEIHTEASITAKPFFLAKGYLVEGQQVRVRKGISLITFKMRKKIV